MKGRYSWAAAFVLGSLAGATVSSKAETPSTPADSTVDSTADSTARVVALETAERRGPASGKADIRVLARGQEAFVGHLRIAADAGVPEHRDPTEEYIHVLTGNGTITIEGETHTVQPGDTIYMPADALVSYTNGSQEMTAIQVFAGPSSADKYDAWPVIEE